MRSSFGKVFMGAAGTSGEALDDQFNRVSFLSHFEGSNNGVNNAFDDGSANNYTVTAAGNITQGSFGPFARPDGEWGVDMPSGPIIQNNYAGSVEVASHSDFTLSGQYTIEFFVNSTTLKNPGGASNIGLFAVGPENNANSMNLFFAGTTVRYWNSAAYNTFGVSSDVVTNSWIHVAVCRNSSNVITCFINGTALGTTFSDTTTPQGQVVIGAEFYETARYNSLVGSISNFRILNGTCLYTSNFTAPTSALTAITNTKLLTCQSNRFVDNSASAHAVTVTGNPSVIAFGPFLTSEIYSAATNGASAYMDGTGDTLRATWTAADIINQNFTLEYWLYFQETSGYGTVSIGVNDGSGSYVHLSYASNGQVFSDNGQNSGSGPDAGAGAISPNSWNHLALVRVSNDMFIYINGVKKATKAITASLFNGQSGEFGIGYIANPLEGYICDARIVTSAVYTGSTYTVPTAPLTAITNTKLLLNMKDGQAIDSAAQRNLTLYGNAKISTGQAKFGDTSLYLDGSNDYLVVNDHIAYGTGPFTIEMFFRLDSVSGSRCLYDDRPDGASGDYIALIIASGAVNFYVGTTLKVNAGSISANTFYHIALCRSGTDTKLFLDGTQIGSTFSSDSTDYLNTGILRVGTNRGYNNDLEGYIDDFRISHMARYTSNFTAPTKAFPDKGQ